MDDTITNSQYSLAQADLRHRGLLVQAAVGGLRSIYKPSFNVKAGVHLPDFQDGSYEQGELDLDEGVEDLSGLMKALDELNDRYGHGTVSMASAGTGGLCRRWARANAKPVTTRRPGRTCRSC